MKTWGPLSPSCTVCHMCRTKSTPWRSCCSTSRKILRKPKGVDIPWFLSGSQSPTLLNKVDHALTALILLLLVEPEVRWCACHMDVRANGFQFFNLIFDWNVFTVVTSGMWKDYFLIKGSELLCSRWDRCTLKQTLSISIEAPGSYQRTGQ